MELVKIRSYPVRVGPESKDWCPPKKAKREGHMGTEIEAHEAETGGKQL